MLGHILIDGVIKKENLIASVNVRLDDGCLQDSVFGVTGQVEDSILVVLHPADVVVERNELLWVISRKESKKLCKFHSV